MIARPRQLVTHNPAWDAAPTWINVLPPSRPSTAQVNWLWRRLKHAEPKRIAVLGSTPEYRRLAARFQGTEVVVLERSQSVFDDMSSQIPDPSASEIVNWGDWRESLTGFDGTFDLVFSDLTSGNIPYVDRRLFYRNVAGSLSKNGLFIDRVLQHESALSIPVSRVIAKFRNGPITIGTINHFNCLLFFQSEFVTDLERVRPVEIAELAALQTSDPVISRLISLNSSITPLSGQWWYGKSWQSLASDYFEQFTIVDELSEPQHSPYSPIGFLRILSK